MKHINGYSEFKKALCEKSGPCWDGYKIGSPKTKISSKSGKRVNNCVPVDEDVTEAKGGQIMPGDYVKSQYGDIYLRVDGKVGGADAYVRVIKGKAGKRKTGLHHSVKLTLVNKDGLEESVNDASNNLEKIFGTDQETMDMFQRIEDEGTVKDMIEFIDEFGNEEMLSRYGIRSTAQVKKLAKTIMNEATDFNDPVLIRIRQAQKHANDMKKLDAMKKEAEKEARRNRPRWTQKKYDKWLDTVASNGGAENAFDMAKNAEFEPGLIDWVKKEFRGDDPLQRIQWDIEAFAESVVNENKFIKKYTEFLFEKKKEKESFEDKIEGDGYYKGISTSTARQKVDQMKKQSQMSDDDPDAYKEMPGDTKGKKLLKKSKHTKAFDDLYADEALEEMVTNESVMSELHVMMEEAKNFNQFRKMFYEEFSDKVKPNKDMDSWLKSLYEEGLGESLEEKAGGDRSPIKGKGIETGLKKKSEQTGVSLPLLRLVMRRGMAAWKSGHRPGAGQEQWGYARVNSFLTKAPGTWGRPLDDPKKNGPKGKFGADADIAKEVIKKGEDKKLKTTGLPK